MFIIFITIIFIEMIQKDTDEHINGKGEGEKV